MAEVLSWKFIARAGRAFARAARLHAAPITSPAVVLRELSYSLLHSASRRTSLAPLRTVRQPSDARIVRNAWTSSHRAPLSSWRTQVACKFPRQSHHVGLQTARNFSTKPAMDVALNVPLGIRMLMQGDFNQKKKQAGPQRTRQLRSMAPLSRPSFNALPRRTIDSSVPFPLVASEVASSSLALSDLSDNLSTLSQTESGSEQAFVMSRTVTSRPVRYSILFPVQQTPSLYDVDTDLTDTERLFSFSFLRDLEVVQRQAQRRNKRIQNAIGKIQMAGLTKDFRSVVLPDDRQFIVADINPDIQLLDVQQVMGIYASDESFFEIVDWKAIDGGEEAIVAATSVADDATSVADDVENSFIMPRVEDDWTTSPTSASAALTTISSQQHNLREFIQNIDTQPRPFSGVL